MDDVKEFLSLEELFERHLNIDAVLRRQEENRKKHHKMPEYLYPFQIGYASICKGRVFREIFDWEKKPQYPIELLRIFEAGNEAEKSIIEQHLDLYARERLGIENIEFQVPCRVESLRLSGRCDALASINKKKYVLEIKSTSTFSFKKVSDEYTMKNDDSFHRIYYYQAQCYCIMYEVDTVLMLFRNKESNEFKCVPVHRDMSEIQNINDWCNEIWKEVDESLSTGAEPALDSSFFSPSQYACFQCPHKEYCLHGNKLSPVRIVLDEELLEKMRRLEATKGIAKEHEELDSEIKNQIKTFAQQNYQDELRRGVKFGVGAEFLCTVKEIAKKNPPKPEKPDTIYQQVKIEKV